MSSLGSVTYWGHHLLSLSLFLDSADHVLNIRMNKLSLEAAATTNETTFGEPNGRKLDLPEEKSF